LGDFGIWYPTQVARVQGNNRIIRLRPHDLFKECSSAMPLILILVILLIISSGGGYYMGPGVGYYGGGGISVVLLIVILFLLFGRSRSRL
jgi:hypothetical protein